MKRKSLRTLVCALLASLALTTFAFADNGPKPQLIVRVKNAPQEPYYLDLLAKGDWDAEDGNRIDGIDWNYDGKEDTLDPDLLALHHCATMFPPVGTPAWRRARPAHRCGASCTRKGRMPLAMHCTGSATSVCRAPTASSSSPNPARSGSPIYSIAAFCNRPSRSTGRTIRRQSPFPFPQPSPATCCNLSQRSCRPFSSGRAAASVPLFVEEKLGSVFTCQRSDTGLLAVASVYVTAHNGVSAWYLFFFLLPAELIILLVELYLYAGCGLLTGHSKGAPRPMRSPPIWLPLFSAIIWPCLSGGSLFSIL